MILGTALALTFLQLLSCILIVKSVKNKNYIIVPSIQVFPSAQSIEGLTKMAKGLHPDAF